jgi:8-oxo-dGTP pyrophosphatase MutT (NUDIX family)
MDLSIDLNNTILYIRVAVLIKGQNGYIFEKHKDDYVFIVGGKIQLNETSLQAAKRELKEELNLDIIDLKFKSIIENIYKKPTGQKVHEICFLYETASIYDKPLDDDFVEINNQNKDDFDIRPLIIKEFIGENNSNHIIYGNNLKL